MTNAGKMISLLSAWGTLLDGPNLTYCCLEPWDDNPDNCFSGMARIAAYMRHVQQGSASGIGGGKDDDDIPSLVIPNADFRSPFVHMHPLQWSVNKKVLHDRYGWKVFSAASSLVTNDFEFVDLEGLQTDDMPLLLTNVAVPPSNEWFPYTRPVYFDDETRLAVLSIVAQNEIEVTQPPLESAMGALDYIARLNREMLVATSANTTTTTTLTTAAPENTTNQSESRSQSRFQQPIPWIPVVYYSHKLSPTDYREFRDGLLAHTNPPALLIDISLSDTNLTKPVLRGNPMTNETNPTTWIFSYQSSRTNLNRFEMLVNTNVSDEVINDHTEPRLWDVTVDFLDLFAMPESMKDSMYLEDIAYMQRLGSEALENDPIVGESGKVPLTRDTGATRRCMGGECVIGNLFTDALRNYTGADVAFITSGGLRGEGWDAGPVRVSNLWAALPFPNSVCTGVMTGISLFRLFNYSTSVATFQSTYTSNGDRLLQVSGMRYTYNTHLNVSRLLNIEIWDDELRAYRPIERLRLYKFASDSFLCGISDPFPDLLVNRLTIQGEVPGVIDTDSLVHQFIVAHYLTELGEPYNTTLHGRLRNATNTTDEPMNLVQTKKSCPPETSWDGRLQTCLSCPEASNNVAFSDEVLRFVIERNDDLNVVDDHHEPDEDETRQPLMGRTVLVNRDVYPVTVKPKVVPLWINFVGLNSSGIFLLSGESLGLDFTVATDPATYSASSSLSSSSTSSSSSSSRTISSIVAFGVLDGRSANGCVGLDISFRVESTFHPSPDLNQLGQLRYVGIALFGLVASTSVGFAVMVIRNRNKRVIQTMQPPFLIQICAGILIMSASIIPLSIDDEIVSTDGCHRACMAIPWLMSMGFTISFAALFTKLWRINKLFRPSRAFKRKQVRARDVILPFLVLFALNCAFLSAWTAVDPLRWERHELEGQPWNSSGHCVAEGRVSITMLIGSLLLNAGALLLACHQAFLARNISSGFSESRHMGIALFSWFQVLIVGGPVLFLMEGHGSDAQYFLIVATVFVSSISMLLLIFVPVFVTLRRQAALGRQGGGGSGATTAMATVLTGGGANRSVIVSGIHSAATAALTAKAGGSGVYDRDSLPRTSSSSESTLKTQMAALQASVSHLREEKWKLEDRNEELKRMVNTYAAASNSSNHNSMTAASASASVASSFHNSLSDAASFDRGQDRGSGSGRFGFEERSGSIRRIGMDRAISSRTGMGRSSGLETILDEEMSLTLLDLEEGAEQGDEVGAEGRPRPPAPASTTSDTTTTKTTRKTRTCDTSAAAAAPKFPPPPAMVGGRSKRRKEKSGEGSSTCAKSMPSLSPSYSSPALFSSSLSSKSPQQPLAPPPTTMTSRDKHIEAPAKNALPPIKNNSVDTMGTSSSNNEDYSRPEDVFVDEESCSFSPSPKRPQHDDDEEEEYDQQGGLPTAAAAAKKTASATTDPSRSRSGKKSKNGGSNGGSSREDRSGGGGGGGGGGGHNKKKKSKKAKKKSTKSTTTSSTRRVESSEQRLSASAGSEEEGGRNVRHHDENRKAYIDEQLAGHSSGEGIIV